MSNEPDPKDLRLSVLINNMIYATQDKLLAYRRACMNEIDRRFPLPIDMALDAVKGEVSSTQETQNFIAPTNYADEQPDLVIEVDFEKVWNYLNFLSSATYINNTDKEMIIRLMNIFQNPAIIKHKDGKAF